MTRRVSIFVGLGLIVFTTWLLYKKIAEGSFAQDLTSGQSDDHSISRENLGPSGKVLSKLDRRERARKYEAEIVAQVDPWIARIVDELQNSELSRATFDRKYVEGDEEHFLFTISPPSQDELRKLRLLVQEVQGLDRVDGAVKESWEAYLSKTYGLGTPNSDLTATLVYNHVTEHFTFQVWSSGLKLLDGGDWFASEVFINDKFWRFSHLMQIEDYEGK